MNHPLLSRRSLVLLPLLAGGLAARAQNVGVGTLTPSEKLDVVGGNLKISTGGSTLIFPDGTTQGTAATGTGFIQNRSTPQQTGGFNVSGFSQVGAQFRSNMGLQFADRANTNNNFEWYANNGVARLYSSVVNRDLLFVNTAGNVGLGTSAPSNLLDLGTTAGSTPTDAAAKKLAVYNNSAGTDFYGLGTSPSQLHLFAGAAATEAPGLSLTAAGNVGIGTVAPLGLLSITPNDPGVKISLFDGGSTTSHSGLGVSAGQLNYHVADANNDHVFYAGGKNGNGTELLRVEGNGRVGIGTGSPNSRLSFASVAEPKITLWDGGSTTAHLGFGVSGGQLNYHVPANNAHVFYAGGKNGDGTELLRLRSDGSLGLGTNNPLAKLHINGGVTTNFADGGAVRYFNASIGLTSGSNTPQGRTVALYVEGGSVFVNSTIHAGVLTVSSDARIKKVVGLSDGAADLALLNRLRITDYTYLDQLTHGNQVTKKVIAQEVETVLPAAVSRSTQAIPNVYANATAVRFADGFITLTCATPHGLPAAGGRLRLYTPANADLSPEVTVVDARTVRFASAEAHAAGLFVYGRYVDDFRSVDYDALTTLAVSATQELARQVAALEQQNAELHARNAALDQRQQADRARADRTAAAQLADHAALETLAAEVARLREGALPAAQARR